MRWMVNRLCAIEGAQVKPGQIVELSQDAAQDYILDGSVLPVPMPEPETAEPEAKAEAGTETPAEPEKPAAARKTTKRGRTK